MTEIAKKMTAAVLYGIRDVRIEERDTPRIGPDDVLIEVSHCGICGSDIHFIVEWPGAAKPGAIEGHEFSGRIVALGQNVAGWQIGDEVVGGPSGGCGQCRYCQETRPSLCERRGKVGANDDGGDWQGAFARYKSLPARQLLRVPDGLSMKHAALAEPMAVALHGISRAGGASPQKRYLVTGGGPIGFLTVAALIANGVAEVVVSEPHEMRRDLCSRLGATVVTPDDLVAPAMPHEIVEHAFDVVLECSGRKEAMEAGLAQLRRGGRMVLVGAGIRAPRFDPNRILLNELEITGSFVYDDGGFEQALGLLASGRIRLDLLVEADDIPLDGIVEASVALFEGRRPAKAMVVPQK